MDTLSPELVIVILGYLDHCDLLSASRTNRRFRALARNYFLFDVLHLDGAQGMPVYHQRGGPFGQYVAAPRERTVQFSELDSVVDELVEMGIAPLVKTFTFSPRVYVKGALIYLTHLRLLYY